MAIAFELPDCVPVSTNANNSRQQVKSAAAAVKSHRPQSNDNGSSSSRSSTSSNSAAAPPTRTSAMISSNNNISFLEQLARELYTFYMEHCNYDEHDIRSAAAEGGVNSSSSATTTTTTTTTSITSSFTTTTTRLVCHGQSVGSALPSSSSGVTTSYQDAQLPDLIPISCENFVCTNFISTEFHQTTNVQHCEIVDLEELSSQLTKTGSDLRKIADSFQKNWSHESAKRSQRAKSQIFTNLCLTSIPLILLVGWIRFSRQ